MQLSVLEVRRSMTLTGTEGLEGEVIEVLTMHAGQGLQQAVTILDCPTGAANALIAQQDELRRKESVATMKRGRTNGPLDSAYAPPDNPNPKRTDT